MRALRKLYAHIRYRLWIRRMKRQGLCLEGPGWIFLGGRN